MKVQILWGFVDGADHHRTNDELEVTQQVGHDWIGRGLAREIVEPKVTKPAAPKETK